MGISQDLTGQRFGKWIVIERLPSITKKYSSGSIQTIAQYRCKCECGTEKILGTNAIKHSNSCGCNRSTTSKKNREQNIIGKKYGKLTVVDLLGQIVKGKKDNYWLCKCDCGNYSKTTTGSLNSGNTTSCGCMKRYRPVKLIPNGKIFGRLTVLRVVGGKSYCDIEYECICDCGNTCIVKHKNLIGCHKISCGCLHIERAKENIKPMCQIRDISNKRFGKLVALKPTEKRLRNSVMWICKCDCGNIAYIPSSNLREGEGGTISCGCASSKGNIAIEKFLKSNQFKYKMEYSFDDLRGIGNGLLRYDACVFNSDGTVRKLIEYDGEFHYKKQYSLDSYEATLEHDRRKNSYCKEHHLSLLRIPYWEYDNIEHILKTNL